MQQQQIAVIRGDGIGPSIVESALRILDHAGCNLSYEYVDAGLAALDTSGELLPEQTLAAVERNGIALKGPLTTPVGQGFTSVNVALRQRFQLYANVRPVVSIAGARARFENIDLITVRENTEGMYCGQGQVVSDDDGIAQALSVITRKGAERILRFAYELAEGEKRECVTVVHKANILKSTSGLFLRVAREISRDYPQIETREMIVDNACMQLVMDPHQFDVIVTTNLFGDILSDLCAGLVGGLGLAPGANIGAREAIFEAVHGSAPDIAGQDIANPTSMILSACLMLDHMEMSEQAQRIRRALREVIATGDRTTRDLGGSGGTTHFTESVIERLG